MVDVAQSLPRLLDHVLVTEDYLLLSEGPDQYRDEGEAFAMLQNSPVTSAGVTGIILL